MASDNPNVNKNNSSTQITSSDTINPNLIDHLRHPLALKIRSLLVREERKALKEIIIDDEENIIEAIKAKIKLDKIITTDREQLSKEFFKQLPPDVAIIDLAKRTGKKIFGNEKISRIFAIAKMPESISLEFLKKTENDFIVLDKLSISGNIGAIIRTSAALALGAIILLDSEFIDIYDRRVIRASRGYVFKVPIVNMNTKDFITFCRHNSIKMLVTTAYTDTAIEEIIDYPSKLAIIFGSEKEGCSKELTDAAEIKAKIPIQAGIESLNVSAAASIILYLRDLSKRKYYLTKAN